MIVLVVFVVGCTANARISTTSYVGYTAAKPPWPSSIKHYFCFPIITYTGGGTME
jgi:hypothetical protein